MPNTWNGEERRKATRDHDTLVEVVQILRSHVNNFDKHQLEDKENFKEIFEKMWKHASLIYIGFGIVVTLEFLLKGGH